MELEKAAEKRRTSSKVIQAYAETNPKEFHTQMQQNLQDNLCEYFGGFTDFLKTLIQPDDYNLEPDQ